MEGHQERRHRDTASRGEPNHQAIIGPPVLVGDEIPGAPLVLLRDGTDVIPELLEHPFKGVECLFRGLRNGAYFMHLFFLWVPTNFCEAS